MADAVTPITTHATDALARLLQQFKSKPKIAALLNAINEQVQQYEDDVGPLSDVLDIDAMGGVNLDNLGNIVGQDREGRSDADYRIAIREKIAENASSGTADQLIAIFETLTGSATIIYTEEYPAGFCLYGDGTYPDSLFDAIEAAKPGGVYFGLADTMLWEDSDPALWEDSDPILVVFASTGR